MSFIDDAVRTKSPNFYEESVELDHVVDVMAKFIVYGNQLDDIKKTLFYNKDTSAKIQDNGKDYDTLDVSRANLPDVDIVHAVLGIATEAVEMVEALHKSITEVDEFDEVNFVEEMGDNFWYLAIAANALGITFEEVQYNVIAKLKHRFPDAYSNDKANNRDLEGERKILEGNK